MTLMYWTNYSKRLNSTAYPTGGTVIDVKLKTGTSILNPSLLLELPFNTASSISYVLWNLRYYFVQNVISYTNTIVELVCNVDVLATYRTSISTYTCYVERTSDASFYDIFVNDSSISSQYNVISKKAETSSEFPGFTPSGSFLLRCIGKGNSASSLGIATYAINASQIQDVLNFLFTDDNFDFLSDTSVKSFFNPFQYITDCRWTPFGAGYFEGESETVKLGWWDSGISAKRVTGTGIGFNVLALIPKSVYTDFRQYNPRFSKAKICLPSVGIVDVDSLSLLHGSSGSPSNNTFSVKYSIDVATGDSWVDISNGDYVVGHYSGNMFTSISIGQLTVDALGVTKNVVGGIADLFSLDFGRGVSSIFEGVENITKPETNINGSAGNMEFMLNNPYVTGYRIDFASKDIPLNNIGRPCCRNLTLGNLRGYIQCGKASCPISGTESEKSQLNSYLNGGFYYE